MNEGGEGGLRVKKYKYDVVESLLKDLERVGITFGFPKLLLVSPYALRPIQKNFFKVNNSVVKSQGLRYTCLSFYKIG